MFEAKLHNSQKQPPRFPFKCCPPCATNANASGSITTTIVANIKALPCRKNHPIAE